MNNDAAQLPMIAATNNQPGAPGKRSGNWFEAMASAWGEALDNQANRIVERADELVGGEGTPQQVTMMTAESLRMQFLSNSSHTAISSTGTALETMARKQ